MVVFVRWELRAPEPLLRLQIFANRGFAAETTSLGLMSIVFVPFFFFASVYSQVSLGKTSSEAGLYLLYFFLGFVIASQIGGRILDRRGARPAIVFGSAISAVGFYLLAGRLTDLSLSKQWVFVMLAGAGIGLMLTPASTDAVSRAPSTSYSEVTGITQTVRYLASTLGLALLGTILIDQNRSDITHSLTKEGVPKSIASHVADTVNAGASAQPQPGTAAHRYLPAIQYDYAQATKIVYIAMAAVMAFCFVVALRRMEPGIPKEVSEAAAEDAPQAAAATTG